MFTLNVMCKQRQYNQKTIFLRWVHTMNCTYVEYLSASLSLFFYASYTKSSSFPLVFFLSSHTQMYLAIWNHSKLSSEHGKVNGNVFRNIAEAIFHLSPSCHHAFGFCLKKHCLLENTKKNGRGKNETSSSNFICESRGFCSCWLNSTVQQ